MKNIYRIVSLILIVVIMATVLVACTTSNTDDPLNEKIDTSRTQIYVYNFAGGYGTDWLVALKKRYEELHKDDVYEEGKKGVQVYINAQKTSIESYMDSILDNRDEVYFAEYVDYFTLISKGVVADITEAVTGDLGSYGDPAGTTIESKLSAQLQDYYGVSDGTSKKYYALPHYSAYNGLAYNIDLFEERGYYFRDDTTDVEFLEDYFVLPNSDEKRSAGPDGKYGTSDDGLPATYEEFFLLCDYIAYDGNTPVVWNGVAYQDYLNDFLQAMIVDYEGLENTTLNYTMEGTATDLGKIVNGEFVFDTTPTTITASNGYELKRQAGKYYALSFLERLVKTDKYHGDKVFNNAYWHTDAQDDFLYSGHDGVTKSIAMLCEGVWWQAESAQTFIDMANMKGDEFSMKNRNIGWLPLPKATSDKVGKSTLFDKNYATCFVKKNVADWKMPLINDFLKFIHTNQSLVEFTQITNTPKGFNYTLTDAEKEALTPFGRSLIELKENSDVAYPYASTSVYKNNQSQFKNKNQSWSLMSGLTEQQWAPIAMHDKAVTSIDYFTGMYNYYQSRWSILYSIK